MNTLRAPRTGPGGVRSTLVGTGAVLGVVLAAAATLVALRGTAAGACNTATPVKIVAAPAIAPVIQEITKRDIDATCIAIRIVPQNAADVSAELAGGSNEPPALWIPDSSLWPKRARKDAASQGGNQLRIEEHEPIAISPLVAVTARKDAAKLGWPDTSPGWQELIAGPIPTTIGDPLSTTEGLATLLVVRQLLGNPDGTPRPELVGALLQVGRGAVPAVQSAYDRLGGDSEALAFTATEQSVVSYNRAGGRAAVVAMYPKDGTVSLDYPVVRVSRPEEPSALADAAETVDAALRTPEALNTLQAAGFRARDGSIGGGIGESSGIRTARPTLVPLPSIEEATEVLRTWSAITLDVRMLVVIDVSGSMDADAGNGMTRIELARDAALTALGLFPETTEVGLWAFSIQQAPPDDWIALVSMGLFTDDVGGRPRRQALQEAFASLPSRTEGGTGLNDTLLAAFRTQRAGYDAGRVNSVVVLTDGRNEDPNGIRTEALLNTLRTEADPARPVPIIPIGMGPEVDFPTLQQIAAATGGKAYLASNPADIRSVFLDAIIERRCRPGC
jgi:Ca-activated chloride channel family protein